mmetsp:Transcript_13907/g.30387  ORF Transcript_13907/g.30387 Transcript_13907/m.30387 type:complete len:580 (+) Transcript_13907:995-2734(+)
MQFSRRGNNVFTGFFGVAQNHRIGLGKTLHTFDQLGQIGRVLGLDGATHNGRHGELHRLNGAGIVLGGNGTRLEQVLINADKSTGVTGRNVSNLFCVTSHHDHSTLNVLDPQFGLLAGNKVGTHDANLLSGSDLSRENTSKGVETSLIRGGDHLGNVHTKRSAVRSIASTNGGRGLVVQRTVIEGIDTILLGLCRRRQVKHNHLQNGVTGWEPLLHDTLQELLSNKFLFVGLELDVDCLKHLLDLSVLFSHNGFEKRCDGRHDELTESTFQGASLVAGGPDLAGAIKVPVTPKLFHHLFLGDTEFGTIVPGETLEGEGPLVKTGTKGNGSLCGVDLKVTQSFFIVGGDNHIDGFNRTAKGLVKLFRGKLEFEKGTIDLVNHENGLDTFTNGLTKHGFGLDANSINGIDNNQSTISHTKCGSHLGREINVTWAVNQVDQVGFFGNLNIGFGILLGGHIGGLCCFVFLGKTGNFSGLHIVLEKHGDSGGLDGNTTFGFIGTSIRVTSTTSGLGRNNTCLLHQRIRKRCLTVIDVSNHRHGTDVVLQVHNGPHLFYCKVHHLDVVLLQHSKPRILQTESRPR